MSDHNMIGGKEHYASGGCETRAWFERQWKVWPTRAHKERTTNISFHYGGVLAFRAAHGREPEMSRDFQSHVDWLDRAPVR